MKHHRFCRRCRRHFFSWGMISERGRALPGQISRCWRPIAVLGHMAFPLSHPDPECRGKVRTLLSLQEKKQNPKPHRSPRIPPAPSWTDSSGRAAPFPAQTRGGARDPAQPLAAALLLPHVLGAHVAASRRGLQGLPPAPRPCRGHPLLGVLREGGRQPPLTAPRGVWGPSAPGSTLPVPDKVSRHPGADVAPARTPPRPPWPWAAACGPGPGVGRSAEAPYAASTSPAVSLGHVALGWLEGRILATSFSGEGESCCND